MALQEGWSTEVHDLRKRGFGADLKPMQAIGYRELNQALDGTLEFESLRQRIGKSTRTYAKRQLTWFKKEKVQWFESPQALLEDRELQHTIHQFLKRRTV